MATDTREPQVFETAMRAVATREALRGPCPQEPHGGEHELLPGHLTRLSLYGGIAKCVRCQCEVRLIERPRVDVALSLIESARIWAGLPRFTETQRTFLRAVAGGRDPIITALQTNGMFAEYATDVDVPVPLPDDDPRG